MSGSGVPFGLSATDSFTREELVLILEGLYYLSDSELAKIVKDKIRIRIENIDKCNNVGE